MNHINLKGQLKAIIHEAEEGGYWVEIPSLPGCFTQAESIEEIESNVNEAVKGYLETIINMGQTFKIEYEFGECDKNGKNKIGNLNG